LVEYVVGILGFTHPLLNYICVHRNLGMCNGIVMGIEKVTDMKKAKKGN
jgi:hypothetical protein